jgi:copper oxidase (laccase) domain-containing protein
VGEDFVVSLSEEDKVFLFKTDGRRHFDLPSKIRADLLTLGIKEIVSSGSCTFKDLNFYSYRRDKTQKRMLSFIFKGKPL